MDTLTRSEMNISQNSKIQLLLNEGSVTNLLFEDDNIILRVINGINLSDQTIHQAGSMRNILRYLQSEPATAFELEAAIAAIEDELMPVIPLLPSHRFLVTSKPVIHQIAGLGSGTDNSHLDIAEVERLFNCLTDVAYGTPAKFLGIPEDREFAFILLYLRELMHHAGYSAITLLDTE
jgi:hypothetical protein